MSFISIFCLIMTLSIYVISKKIYHKFPYFLLSPAVLVPVILIIFLAFTHISYETYMIDNHWIVWLLSPATVAFAIPIYEYRKMIKQHIISISMGVFIGMFMGMLSAFYLAQLFQFNQITTYSLMARSISTPFAMELVNHIGGSIELVILFTMITGVIGMLFGDLILAAIRLKSHFALGASLGSAAHGFGTSKAYMRHQEEGIIASLTMVLSGVFMVVLGPSLVHFILMLNV